VYSTKDAEDQPPLSQISTNQGDELQSESLVGDPSNGNDLPKATIKVGNISLDRAELRKLLSSYEGFYKVAFYRDYVYVCIRDVECATKAIAKIHSTTKMKAVFPKYDYTSRNNMLNVGTPNPLLHVSNLPYNATPEEFSKLFKEFNGCEDVVWFRESCLIRFSDSESAKLALEELNRTTNLVVVFSRRERENQRGEKWMGNSRILPSEGGVESNGPISLKSSLPTIPALEDPNTRLKQPQSQPYLQSIPPRANWSFSSGSSPSPYLGSYTEYPVATTIGGTVPISNDGLYSLKESDISNPSSLTLSSFFNSQYIIAPAAERAFATFPKESSQNTHNLVKISGLSTSINMKDVSMLAMKCNGYIKTISSGFSSDLQPSNSISFFEFRDASSAEGFIQNVEIKNQIQKLNNNSPLSFSLVSKSDFSTGLTMSGISFNNSAVTEFNPKEMEEELRAALQKKSFAVCIF